MRCPVLSGPNPELLNASGSPPIQLLCRLGVIERRNAVLFSIKLLSDTALRRSKLLEGERVFMADSAGDFRDFLAVFVVDFGVGFLEDFEKDCVGFT